MTTERQAQVRQPFELTEHRAADVATMARRNWVPDGHTHEDIDGVFVGAMAHLRELALGQLTRPGPPRLCRNVHRCGRAAFSQSGPYHYCCGTCFLTYAEEHGDECNPGRDDVGDSAV